jgi:hypothetical protein
MFKHNRTAIRSIGLAKINRLVRAARHLDSLRTAFAAWNAGEIYVCKKTGTYRYRFGANAKSVAPWSKFAVECFGSPSTFALAATVLDDGAKLEVVAAPEKDAGRANIINLVLATRSAA